MPGFFNKNGKKLDQYKAQYFAFFTTVLKNGAKYCSVPAELPHKYFPRFSL